MIDYSQAKLTTVDPQDLIGKRIIAVDNSSVNVLLLEFSDGSSVAIDSEIGGLGIPSILVNKEK